MTDNKSLRDVREELNEAMDALTIARRIIQKNRQDFTNPDEFLEAINTAINAIEFAE